MSRTDWGAQRAKQLAFGQSPQAHRFVFRPGGQQRAGCVHADAPNYCRVHAGIDAKLRLLGRRAWNLRVEWRGGEQKTSKASHETQQPEHETPQTLAAIRTV